MFGGRAAIFADGLKLAVNSGLGNVRYVNKMGRGIGKGNSKWIRGQHSQEKTAKPIHCWTLCEHQLTQTIKSVRKQVFPVPTLEVSRMFEIRLEARRLLSERFAK